MIIGQRRNKMDIEKADKYNWELFTLYCLKEGISLENEEDWKAWWQCWKAGVDACY